jgi:hypothetical protein
MSTKNSQIKTEIQKHHVFTYLYKYRNISMSQNHNQHQPTSTNININRANLLALSVSLLQMFFQIVADPQGPTNPPVIGCFQRLQGGICRCRWSKITGTGDRTGCDELYNLFLPSSSSKSTSKLLRIVRSYRWKAQAQSNNPSSERGSAPWCAGKSIIVGVRNLHWCWMFPNETI